MSNLFTEPELTELAAAVETQLRDVREREAIAVQKSGEPPSTDVILAKQNETITTLTKEPPKHFLVRFGQAAKADLCEDSGLLHKQWQKWGDLDNKDAVERLGAVLLTMGFSGGVVRSLVVATVVIVVHIGIKAFCEDYGQASTK
jgi:hypothetical protein